MDISGSLDFLLKVGSMVAVVLAVNYAFRDVIAGFLPKPPPPKPRPYRVTIETDEGWPLRTYTLDPASTAKVVRDLDHERDRERDKTD